MRAVVVVVVLPSSQLFACIGGLGVTNLRLVRWVSVLASPALPRMKGRIHGPAEQTPVMDLSFLVQ